MAFSIVSNLTSGKFYPSNNPINITVNSSNSGSCNFRYIADVYINGTNVFRHKLFPDPSTGYGFFQFSRIVQDYMSNTIPNSPYTNAIVAASSTTAPGSVVQVYVRFGEEYDSSSDCSGSVVQYSNLVTSNTAYSFNGVISYKEFNSFDYTDYLVTWGTSSSFNGEFATATGGWPTVTGNNPSGPNYATMSLSAGTLLYRGEFESVPLSTTSSLLSLDVGSEYYVSFDIVRYEQPYNTLYVKFGLGTQYSSGYSGTGSYNFTATCSGNSSFSVMAYDNDEFYGNIAIDNLVVTKTTQATTASFLTTHPTREIDVTYNDSYFLDFYTTTNPTIPSGALDGYAAMIVEIATKELTYPYLSSVVNIATASSISGTPRRYRLACGPYDLNKIYSGVDQNYTTIGQLKPVSIGSDNPTYSVKVGWVVDGAVVSDLTETITFNVVEPRAFQTRFGYIGTLGSIEHCTFYQRNMTKYNIERKNFEKNLYSNTSGVWGYSVGDRGTSQYKLNATETHTVASYVDKDISGWLQELYFSPDAWVYDRPELVHFTVFPENGTPVIWDTGDPGSPDPVISLPEARTALPDIMTRMLIRFEKGHGFRVGDYINFIPDFNPDWTDYRRRAQLLEEVYPDCFDIGITFLIYGLTNYAEGCAYKDENWKRLPIVITDTNSELKQKMTKPIEYTVNYTMAFDKETLRPS